MKTNLHVFY